MNALLAKQQPAVNNFTRRDFVQIADTLFNAGVPTYDISRTRNGVEIEIDPAGTLQGSNIGSTITPKVVIRAEDLSNFPHDFTFGHLSDMTDVRFSSVYPVIGDGYDHLSPDVIVTSTGGHKHVVEFTTFRGQLRDAQRAGLQKVSKYEIACENRSKVHPTTLHIIVATRHGVVTNMDMDQAEVNELTFRYRLALDIYMDLIRLFPEIDTQDEEVSRQEREILGVVSMIEMDWNKTTRAFPLFEQRMFDEFNGFLPDEEYMNEIVSGCVNKAKSDIIRESFSGEGLSKEERLKKNGEECRLQIEKEIQSRDSRETRDPGSHKSTVQLPPWIFTEGDTGKGLAPLAELSCNSETVMSSIWSKVIINAQGEEIDRMNDDPDAEYQMAVSNSKDRADEKSRYHRTKIQLTTEEQEYIGSLGVQGAAVRDAPLVKEKRRLGKLPFSTYHDTTMIDEFLTKPYVKVQEVDLYSPLTQDVELRVASARIHQPDLIKNEGTNLFIDAHKLFMRSPLGSWTQMVSVIGSELSASVKQHVKKDFFVVKRLLNSPLYLLIKPTSSDKHIFVSFALDKKSWICDIESSHVFKTYEVSGDLLITDFVSFKLSKLTNLCKTNSLVESAVSFWLECYGYHSWEMDKMFCGKTYAKGPVFMSKLSLLTLLEDKACTEELQTMVRYIVMEGFVSPPELPKPHKMIKKLPKVLRTELQVFLYNRVLILMQRIAENPFQLRKREGQIKWGGLFCPISGDHVSEIQPVINACYNGYFKNKEEETEPSVLSGMYKKIIELEHLKPETLEFLGYSDPKEPQMHEFSRSYLRACCDHAKTILTRFHGRNFMEQIDEQIMREVSHLSLERLATLKATSNFNEGWYNYKDVREKQYSREKLIVRMSEFASSGATLAVQKFEECMSLIESRGNMHICLFKKQQHGGLREIYVLGAEERIVQCMVEAIAKSIGGLFPSDTLCTPANKVRIPETHGVRARETCGDAIWTTATSDDARKWNQGHFVTKFALMLCQFTHQKWWPIIIRGCSMFTKKYMMMNLKYLEILDSHRDLDVEDEFVMDLFLAYHGEKEVPWVKKGETFLRTSTGMMQGILHFTSSLLHTIHQEYIRSLTFRIFNREVQPEFSQKIVCDMMQGSDDSSMMISFPSKNQEILVKAKATSAICFRVKKYLGVYLAIYPSEKSTANTDFVMEYNSEFFFHSQHVRPTIRWIAACCNLPEVETLVARQEEASNLLTSVTEGGGSFSLAAMIQQSQCTLHYQLIGMGTSQLFEYFLEAILRWRDPGLGFFLLDNPYCSGLGGFRFNLFKAITQTDLACIYSYFMKKVKSQPGVDDVAEDWDREEMIVPEACSVSPGGAIVLSSSLKWGSREKFRKLREKLNIPDDWLEKINESPDVLYRAPKTGEEILLRIAEKIHSPGVISSLSTGNAVCKVMASAVYFLSAAIFEDSGSIELGLTENSKYSILQKMIRLEEYFKDEEIMEADDLLFLFPNIEELEQLDLVVFNRANPEVAIRVSNRDATQSRVTIFNDPGSMRVSPEKLVSDKWFHTRKSKIGSTGFAVEWDRLKLIIRWLRDTPEETLQYSPLANHVQIRNFFARLEGRSRTVRITGAPVKKRGGISKLAMVIRDNFIKDGFLRDMEDVSGSSRGMITETLKHMIYSIVQGPYTAEHCETLCLNVLRDMPSIRLKESDGKTRSNILAILQMFARSEMGVLTSIQSIGAGVIGGYVKAQKSYKEGNKVRYYDDGAWRGVMDGVQVHISITNRKGATPYIKSVMISKNQTPWMLGPSIRSWADDMGVLNTVDCKPDRGKEPSFWMKDFRLSSKVYQSGCPVYVASGKMTDFTGLFDKEVKFKIRKNVINLYTESGGRHTHILSYSTSDYDLSPASMRCKDKTVLPTIKSFSREPGSSWMKCEPIQLNYIKPLCEILDGDRQVAGLDKEKLGTILKACTESSLRQKVGSTFSSVPVAKTNAQEIDMDEILGLILEDNMKDSFKSLVAEMKEDVEIGDYEESFDISDLDLFGPAHYREISNLAMVSHPLMDKFVDDVVMRMGRSSVRRLLIENKCDKKSSVTARTLYRILGRDPNSIKIEDYFSASDEEVTDDMLG
ncbi:RNA-dependent RNA polymerase [Itaporanga virus]|uniref:RNA-directed RNA polymerase L n=2 Tax=Itaporanga virus TaxID=629735 RepID=A0A4V1DW07_9VIRU|nr:RNA-dependent RNA polymerase [Itaporanga virus]QCI62749.2 RNA-dependent RNA polymerase [Itaporanga virus]